MRARDSGTALAKARRNTIAKCTGCRARPDVADASILGRAID